MQKKLRITLEDIFKPIDFYLKEVDRVIPEKLLNGISLMDESSLHLFKKSGKKIRASIVILSSGLKRDLSEDIVDIAAAVEIVHASTLVHDDIIDQTFLRRGEKTVAKEWGTKVAVLIGDLMYIRSLQIIMEDEKSLLVPAVVSAVYDMIKGEIYQMEFSNIDVINREHYFNIIRLKTAEFMGTCAKLGGMKSDMNEKETESLYQFGFNLGNAFQIVDDTLDYIEGSDIIGKDAGNDFSNGKITLPFIYLLETVTEQEKKTLVNCVKNPGRETWNTVREMINEYGAIDYSMKIAEEYIERSLPYLEGFPPSVCKEKLLELADFFANRDY